jgi:hypothetical protein
MKLKMACEAKSVIENYCVNKDEFGVEDLYRVFELGALSFARELCNGTMQSVSPRAISETAGDWSWIDAFQNSFHRGGTGGK